MNYNIKYTRSYLYKICVFIKIFLKLTYKSLLKHNSQQKQNTLDLLHQCHTFQDRIQNFKTSHLSPLYFSLTLQIMKTCTYAKTMIMSSENLHLPLYTGWTQLRIPSSNRLNLPSQRIFPNIKNGMFPKTLSLYKTSNCLISK